jgi:predicted peroxiredoxin
MSFLLSFSSATTSSRVETPIYDNIRELVTWQCKEHGVKSCMCQQIRKEVLGVGI